MLLYSNFKHLLLILISVALLASCGSPAVKKEAMIAQVDVAKRLFNSGDYSAAAKEYLKLAETSPELLEDGSVSTDKQDFQLFAAESYIKADDSLNARKTMAQINSSSLVLNQYAQIRYNLATARIAKLDQQPELVISALEQIPLNATSPKIKQEILQMQIAAYDDQGLLLDAARSRALIDPLLSSGTEHEQNRRIIWATIKQQDLTTLQLPVNDPLESWFELLTISKRSLFDTNQFQQDIDQWRLSFPNHAAENPIVIELFEKSALLGKKIQHIALLLPQTGRFAQASAAIRDGFFSAWYDANDQVDQPTVQVYAADANNILDAYQRAVEEGAELIVGPLEKEAIKNLLSLPELSVPTLALNQLADEDQANFAAHIESDQFFQFGLLPEQEAEQVAEKAWAQGYSYSLAITPLGAWGERIYNAFKNRFEALGGVILEHQQYESSTTDYSTPIIKLLNIDSSQARFDKVTKTLNRKIKFIPRPRQDMDFIFMVARPEQARQIRPQLLFHRSASTPVLSTSHAFGMPPRGEPDLDMEGVIIGDMPWLIANQTAEPDSSLSLEQNWPDKQAAFLRLFALGRDAYKIIPQLGRLKLQPEQSFEGDTGVLSINSNAQIHRELSWAQFTNGKPILIDPQPTSTINEFKKPADQ